MNSNEIKISVKIAERTYRLTIDKADEEKVFYRMIKKVFVKIFFLLIFVANSDEYYLKWQI